MTTIAKSFDGVLELYEDTSSKNFVYKINPLTPYDYGNEEEFAKHCRQLPEKCAIAYDAGAGLIVNNKINMYHVFHAKDREGSATLADIYYELARKVHTFIDTYYPGIVKFMTTAEVDIEEIITPLTSFFQIQLLGERNKYVQTATAMATIKTEAELFVFKDRIGVLEREIDSLKNVSNYRMPELTIEHLKSKISVIKMGRQLAYILPFDYSPLRYGEYGLTTEAKEKLHKAVVIAICVSKEGVVTSSTLLTPTSYESFRHYHFAGDTNCMGTYSPGTIRSVEDVIRVRDELQTLYELISPDECIQPQGSSFIRLEDISNYLTEAVGWAVPVSEENSDEEPEENYEDSEDPDEPVAQPSTQPAPWAAS